MRRKITCFKTAVKYVEANPLFLFSLSLPLSKSKNLLILCYTHINQGRILSNDFLLARPHQVYYQVKIRCTHESTFFRASSVHAHLLLHLLEQLATPANARLLISDSYQPSCTCQLQRQQAAVRMSGYLKCMHGLTAAVCNFKCLIYAY